MTGALTDWVRALCGAAVICAAAMALCPDGRVKRVLRLVCGLVMACALLSPVLELDFDAYSSALSGYGEAARAAAEGAQEEARLSSRGVIEEECAAYILDKAEALGLTGCSASVCAEWDSAGYWVPRSCRVCCPGGRSEALAAAIEADLGIPRSRQEWEVPQ